MPANSPDRSKDKGIEKWLKSHIRSLQKEIESENAAQSSSTPIVNEAAFWAIIALTVILMITGGLLIFFFMPSIMFEDSWLPINPQLLAYLPILAFIIVSFRSVGVNQVAGADFFGLPVHQFGNGLKWVPFGILHFQAESASFVQSEFPGDADHIQWSDEKEPLLPGKVRPIFIMTAENPDRKLPGIVRLPTDIQMTVGIAALAKFQLIPERFFDLVKNVGNIDPEKELEIRQTMTGGDNISPIMLEVVRHLRDTTASVMLIIGGQLSHREINEHLDLINQLLFLRLQKLVMSWGIELAEASLTKVNGGHEFNKKIQERADASADKDAAVTRAEGERQKRILEGEGTADARRKLLKAEADGYADVAKVAATEEGQFAISNETAGKLAAAGNTVVVGSGGMTDLLGLVVAGKKVTK